MVERTLSMREAQGSIPWFSTIFCLSNLGVNVVEVLYLTGVGSFLGKLTTALHTPRKKKRKKSQQ